MGIFRFDQCTLDTDRLELRRGGEVVDIEPQVFRLLVHLIENRDRVVDKDELIGAIWEGRIVSDATVNTRINAARRAVGDTGRAQSFIRTFPKRGFRFVRAVDEEQGAGRQGETATVPEKTVEMSKPDDDPRPTIAVLPFERLGDDDEGLGFGLAGDLVTELSRRTGVNVVGREAAFRLPTGPESRTELRQTLGVDYVLTGMVHRNGAQLRISVELCETEYGREIWAERYDRRFEDVFAIQDELSHLILMAVHWSMWVNDGVRASRASQSATSSADRLSQAAQHFFTPTPESYRRAGELLDAVLDEEPRNAMALAMRAFSIFAGASFDVAPLSADDCSQAIRMASVALEQEERNYFAHWVRGTLALNLERNHDAALAHAKRALEINPHYPPAIRLKGEAHCFAGDIRSGVAMLKDQLVNDPRAPANAIVLWDLALAHFAAGDPHAALDAIERALLRMRTMPDLYLARAAILIELNRPDDARAIIDDLQSRYDIVSLTHIRRPPFKQDSDVDKYLRALREAGLQE